MRKISTLRMLAMLPMLLVALTANAQNGISVSTPSMSNCKYDWYEAPKTRTTSPEEGEWLDYSVEKREDGLYLHFIYENLYLNCATSGVEIKATIDGSVITIDEREIFIDDEIYTTCNCPYDVTYDVGPLQEGDYTLVVTYYGRKRAEMKAHIAEPLRGRFNIGEYVTKIEKTELGKVKESKIIYDLQGRRYKTFPFPGIFVQGGKRIIWKGE